MPFVLALVITDWMPTKPTSQSTGLFSGFCSMPSAQYIPYHSIGQNS